jgi:2-iminobutanoate/2-iminopropanoate deaminase
LNEEPISDVEYFRPPHYKNLPFSEAVRVGRTLYLSGHIGVGDSKTVVPGGIAAETRKTLENIKATLEKYGSSLNEVVKATIMLADMGEWAEMNRIYVDYFPDHLPARSAFGVNGLALGARVEIECIAVLKQ